MSLQDKLNELEQFIRAKAETETWDDQFIDKDGNFTDVCVFDLSGGNVDDAYEGGARAGESRFACELLERFFKPE